MKISMLQTMKFKNAKIEKYKLKTAFHQFGLVSILNETLYRLSLSSFHGFSIDCFYLFNQNSCKEEANWGRSAR